MNQNRPLTSEPKSTPNEFAMAANPKFTLYQENVSTKTVRVRRKQVLLDYFVAELYGMPTREVNLAVINHPEKFLKGYVMELNNKELSVLRWKNSTANAGLYFSTAKHSRQEQFTIQVGVVIRFHTRRSRLMNSYLTKYQGVNKLYFSTAFFRPLSAYMEL